MFLCDVENEKQVIIKKFNGGKRFVERLNSMGIYEGMRINVIRHAPFSGPILIEGIDNKVKVMIGRGMARKIEVDLLH